MTAYRNHGDEIADLLREHAEAQAADAAALEADRAPDDAHIRDEEGTRAIYVMRRVIVAALIGIAAVLAGMAVLS